MTNESRRDLIDDLVLPTLLFAALGGLVWAVRGTEGYGSMKGCIFAGVTWGAAWWFIARDPSGIQTRRYASGWIILALAAGIGISGARGWMQWPSFFRGELGTDWSKGQFIPLSKAYGFLWLFIAGVPWGGLGACILAWCAAKHPMRPWQWTVRLACGFGMAYLAVQVYEHFPQVFLPFYDTLKERYLHASRNGADPNLARLIGDDRSALRHLGFYLGFLLYEVARRDWKNVTLILAVGLLTGLGWSACQNWQWATKVWPGVNFNWWRCWESSGGICIGMGYGVAYYLANRRMPGVSAERGNESPATPTANVGPYCEWLVAAGLLVFLGLSMLCPVGELGRGLRGAETASSSLPSYLYIAFGLLSSGILVYCFATRRASGLSTGEDVARGKALLANVEWTTGLGLMLVLGWFIKTQLRGGFSRGASDAWFTPGNTYLAIIVAYIVYSFVTRGRSTEEETRRRMGSANGTPNLDWLTTYLGLLVILSTFVRSELSQRDNNIYFHAYTWIAVIFGIVYYILAYRTRDVSAPSEEDKALQARRIAFGDPNMERWGAYVGLLFGLGLSIKNGLRGWGLVYRPGEEAYWDSRFFNIMSPLMLAGLMIIAVWLLWRRYPRNYRGDVFPHAYRLIWLVLIVQNILAQIVTGPPTNWIQRAFCIYYLVLLIITGLIVRHYHLMKLRCS
ncbi:MAG: hypothetical protein ABIH23_14050 [bacterium]